MNREQGVDALQIGSGSEEHRGAPAMGSRATPGRDQGQNRKQWNTGSTRGHGVF
jgi:hypothetical protein